MSASGIIQLFFQGIIRLEVIDDSRTVNQGGVFGLTNHRPAILQNYPLLEQAVTDRAERAGFMRD